MSFKNKNSLSQAAHQYKVAPSTNAWLRLDAKLQQSTHKKTILQYRWTAYAAVLIAITAIVFLIKSSNDPISQPSAEGNLLTQLYSYNMESIGTFSDDGIYEIKKLKDLKNAYRKLSDKKGM
jgi:hypothetical protein